MQSGIEADEIMRIDEIIAKSRQIVNDSLELTKRSQDRFKTPFAIKEPSADIVPSGGSPYYSRRPEKFLKHTPTRTPRSPSMDFESKFLSVDSKPSPRASWVSYEEAPELKTVSPGNDHQRIELMRLRSEVNTEIAERRNAEGKARDLEEELLKAQADATKKQQLLNRANEEIRSLKLQLENSEAVRGSLHSQLSTTQEEHNRLIRHLEQRDDDIARLQQREGSRRGIDEELREQLHKAQEDVARLHREYDSRLNKLQEDYNYQLTLNQKLKAKVDNRYTLNAKLLQLEEQLHSLRKSETADVEPVSLHQLHELEAKLERTNRKCKQLAAQLASQSSKTSSAPRSPLDRTQARKSSRTPTRKKPMRG